jgi:hypothetical protein
MELAKTILEAVVAIANLAIALGVFVAWKQLAASRRQTRADHQRRMNEFTVNLILSWNEHTLEHRRALEARFPGLIDIQENGRIEQQITNAIAKEIYESKPETPNWELRFSIIRLLNFFEAVAISCEAGATEERLIEASFRGVLTRYNEALHEYISVATRARGGNPWKPFDDLVVSWKHVARRHPAPGVD